MSEFLFNEFDEVSAKEWKQKIQFDLKGADYNETLLWKNNEEIDIKPFYHQDDFEKDIISVPGNPKSWNIAQEIFIDDESIVNLLLLDAIDRGAEAVYLSSEKEFSIVKTFKDFPFSEVPIYFNFRFLLEEFILQLKQFLSVNNATVYYNIDIIGNLARSGNWYYTIKKDHSILQKIFQENTSRNVISVDTSLFQNAGANIVQQLAYGLSQANEYLNHFASTPLDDQLLSRINMTFQVAIGSNYFFEISKIRALRRLYSILASEYHVSEICHIMARPSKRNKTLYDYNVNMLRTTTEFMSAVLGGANTICSLPYDVIFHKSNEFGERIARNQLLILKSESYFNTEKNPADGTYYIESLTEQLTEKALALFKDIETNGGFLKQLKEGTIQRKIKKNSIKEQSQFDCGELVLLGTNKHINDNDHMKGDLELFPFVKTKLRKTLIEPVIEKRLSEKLEQKRLENE